MEARATHEVRPDLAAEDAARRGPDPRPARGARRAASCGSRRSAPTHDVEKLLNSADRQRRAEPRRHRREPGGGARVGRRGPDAPAVPAARLRARDQGPQAHVARDGRRRDDGRRVLVGHKVNPYGFRLGVIYPWKSNWYAGRDYADQLHEDIWIRTAHPHAGCRAPASPRSTSSARATRSGCSSARPAPAS